MILFEGLLIGIILLILCVKKALKLARKDLTTKAVNIYKFLAYNVLVILRIKFVYDAFLNTNMRSKFQQRCNILFVFNNFPVETV